jgi:hypothetical protein
VTSVSLVIAILSSFLSCNSFREDCGKASEAASFSSRTCFPSLQLELLFVVDFSSKTLTIERKFSGLLK